jgi:integrase
MTVAKTAHPANRKKTNLKHNPKTGRWDYDVRLKREDGSIFRRAGSAVSEAEAKSKRDAAYDEFNRDRGEAKEAKRQEKPQPVETLASWTERALGIIREDAAPTTYDAYRYALENHVLPKLGPVALPDLKATRIQEHLNDLANAHGIGVASQSRSSLSRVLQLAATDGIIPSNPVKSTAISRRKRKEQRTAKARSGEIGKRILTMEEGAALLAHTRGTPAYWLVFLGLRFGLRIGEAIGLTWNAVDLDKKLLRVFQQAQYVKGNARYITDPKSAAGVRDIPIPGKLMKELRSAKAKAEEAGIEWVCVDENRKAHHPKHVSRYIKSAVIAAGFDGSDGKDVPTAHDFRSSCLTWLANHANGGAGMKPHELSAIAGHSDWETTMSYYIRASSEDVRSAMDSLF